MNRKSIEGSAIGELFAGVYAWFRDKLTVIFPQSRYSGLNFIGNDEEMANTFRQFLDVFQTGILGITSKEVSLENFDLPDPIKKDIAQRAKTIRQLIATTHESLLLDLALFRKDEIWFAEKNNNESKLYSLDEFKVRNDKIINKDYLLGRYGAIPIFKSFNNLKLA